MEIWDNFGDSISLHGDRLAVGAPYDNGSSGDNTGAVYIFKRTGTTWHLEQEISDQASGFTALERSDYFGDSISLHGDRLAVGATNRSNSNSQNHTYIFKRSNETWFLEQTLSAVKGTHFGSSVALKGRYLAVGAPRENGYNGNHAGAAYIFKRTGTTWVLKQTIANDHTDFSSLSSAAYFGTSVSLDGDLLAVGAENDDGSTANSGSTYVFAKDSSNKWSAEIKLQDNPVTDQSSWQNFKTSNSTEPTNCDSTGSFGTASSSANSLDVTSADNNKWVCFRVKNSEDTYGYAKYQIDTDKPTITFSLTGDLLTASTTATDIATNPVWYHSEHTTIPNCANTTIWDVGQSFKGVTYGRYYCFKISDRKSNTGYGRYQVAQPTPSLQARQMTATIVATTTEANPTLGAEDHFGTKIALDGDYLAVAAVNDDGASGSSTGAVYIFKKTGVTWSLQAEIADQSSGFNQLQSGDEFGSSLALDGDRLAVGAPFDDGHSGSKTGAVYIFKRSGTVWFLEKEISDQSSGFNQLESGDEFGSSLALDGDRLAVGAPFDDGHSGATTGAVYVFKRSGSSWELEETIIDERTGFTNLARADRFGTSVSLDGDRLAVGADYDYGASGPWTGAVYIFKRTGTTWALEQEISDQTTGFINLAAEDHFGRSLVLNDDRLLVGAPFTDGVSGVNTGAVYVFKRTATTWSLEQEIADQLTGFTDLEEGDMFGTSLALDDTRLLVGAPLDDGHSGLKSGAVYVFKRSGTTWALEQAVADQVNNFNSLGADDRFGQSVALDGSRLAAGAPFDDGSGSNTGAAYVLAKNTKHVWSLEVKFRDNPAINRSSWQNFKTSTTTAPSCNASNSSLFGASSASANSVTVNSADNDKWLCFRAKNSANTYGYVKQQIDFDAPTLTLTQVGTTVNATGSSLFDYRYFVGDADPDCSATNGTATWENGSSASGLQDNQWVCFKALKSSGISGYAELEVDLTAPTLTLNQSGTSISVSGTNLSGAAYFKIDNQSDL